jgi:hypothetical protein
MRRETLIAFALAAILYLFSSLLGYGVYDEGAILGASEAVARGQVPYLDFYWIVSPLTLYVQAALQHLLPFLSPVVISSLWKGLSFSGLGIVFVRYLQARSMVDGNAPLPSWLAVSIPSLMMLAGPIHETHLGYTPDAILVGSLAVLLLTWPESSAPPWGPMSWRGLLGSFLAGTSVGFKQEIGVYVFCFSIGLILLRALWTRSVAAGARDARRTTLREVATPILLLCLAPGCLLAYFWSLGATGAMLDSLVRIPLRIKENAQSLVWGFLTIGSPARWFLVALVLYAAFLLVDHFAVAQGSPRPVRSHRFGSVVVWLAVAAVVAGTAGLTYVMLASPNPILTMHFVAPVDPGSVGRGIVYTVYALLYRLTVYATLAALLHDLVRTVRSTRSLLSAEWLGHAVPVLGLVGLLSAAGLAGGGIGHPIRGPRIVVPLFFAALLALARVAPPTHGRFAPSTAQVKMLAACFAIFFLAARVGGVFSVVLVDALHRPIVFVQEFATFVDREHRDELRKIRDLVGTGKDKEVFVYLAEPMLYVYLHRTPPTRSIVHFSDWYSPALDAGEIESLERGVNLVITHASYTREDGFDRRKDDPIRDYIERNFDVVLRSRAYQVWKRRPPEPSG